MAVSVVPKAVIKTIGSRGFTAWSWRMSSSPSTPGIRKSVMTSAKSSFVAAMTERDGVAL